MRVVVAIFALQALLEQPLEELLAVLANGRSGVGVEDESVRDIYATRKWTRRPVSERRTSVKALKEMVDYNFCCSEFCRLFYVFQFGVFK